MNDTLTTRPAWKALESHRDQLAPLHLRKLFADDPARGTRLALDAAGIYFDYSKKTAFIITNPLMVN